MFETVLQQLGINSSIWVQLALFIVAFLILHLFFFTPMMKYLKKREEKTTLLAEQIKEVQIKFEEKQTAYKTEKANLYREVTGILNGYRKQAEGAHHQLVNDGKTKSLETLTQGRTAFMKEYEQVKKELILRINEAETSLVKTLWR